MAAPQISVTNTTVQLSVTTDPVNEISVTHLVPSLTVSDVGLQGPSGDGSSSLTWVSLATGWKTTPVLNTTIADGDVWTYVYEGSSGDVTYYRLVPSGSEQDAFYSTFSGGVLSGLIATKEVAL